MKKTLAFLAMTSLAATANAAIWEFHVDMTGPTTTGSGSDLNQNYPGDFPPIRLDDSGSPTLRLPIGWGSANAESDLESAFTQAVLYASDGTTALYTVAPPYIEQEPDGASGSFDRTITLTDQGDYLVSEQVADLTDGSLANNWILAIETTTASDNISGQLTPVPEPAHYAAVAGLGLLCFAAYRKVKAAPAA